MIPSEYAVGMRLSIVPDGAEGEDLRLCIGVDPDPSGDDYDLRDWPNVAMTALAKIRVFVADVGGKLSVDANGAVTDDRTIEKPRIVGTPTTDIDAAEAARAMKLWKRIFSDGSENQTHFEKGIAALRRGLAAGQFGPAPKVAPTAAFIQTAGLADLTDALTAAPAARALKLRSAALLAKAERGGDVIYSDEGLPVGWWLKQHATWLGADAPLSPTQTLMAKFGAAAPDALLAKASTGASSLKAQAAEDVAAEQVALAGAMAAKSEAGLGRKVRGARKAAGAVKALPTPAPLAPAIDEIISDIIDGEDWGILRTKVDAKAVVPKGKSKRAAQPAMLAAAQAWKRLESIASDGEAEDPVLSPEEQWEEAAGRKFAGIRSYPTLAKYLGLIVDARIAGDAVYGKGTKRGVKLVAADEYDDSTTLPGPGKLVWSSAIWTEGGYFGPCPRLKTKDVETADDPIFSDGCLDLNAKIGTQRRFRLVHDDGPSRLFDHGRKARNLAAAFAGGQSAEAPDETPREARGVSLVDDAAKLQHHRIVQRDLALRTGSASALPIRDAEDHLQGYRLDAALGQAPEGKPAPAETQWRPLMARDLRFGAGDIPSEWQNRLSPRIKSRDDGHARPMVQSEMNGKPATVIHDVLATWQGDSLGVGALADPLKGIKDDTKGGQFFWPDPYRDLAIDLTIDTPVETTRTMPPLRNDQDIWMVGRLCFSYGSGVTLAEVTKRLSEQDPSCALGPHRYRRTLRVGAPDVLLPPDCTLVKAKDEKSLPRGESIDDLVVRDSSVATTAMRFTVPARAPIDMAEQAGLFDRKDESDRPEGAFEGVLLRVEMDEETAHFPVARDGGWTTAPPPEGEENKEKERSRGGVFVLDKAAEKHAPYYPDPMARLLYARFLRVDDEKPDPNFGELATPLAFWNPAAHASNAEPIVLELRGRSENALGVRWGRLGGGSVDVPVDHSGGATLNVPRLNVELRPAQQAILELWSDPDPKILLEQHHVAWSARQMLRSRLPGVSDETIAKALSGAPLSCTHEYRRVRVVHAVERPLGIPKVEADEEIRAITLLVSPEPPPDSDVDVQDDAGRPHRWSEYVAAQGSDTSLWPSEEGGATTFFVGKVRIDRRSTGAFRCEASWDDYRPDGYSVDASGRVFSYAHPGDLARLFSVDLTKTPMGDDLVDLLRDDERAGLRSLSHTFADGRARELTLRLIGTSRFTGYFPKVAAPEDGEVGRYERASPDFNVSKYKAWTSCTFRPPTPDVDRILPTFDWIDDRESRLITFERTSGLRIFLKRNWFASGQGEMLGLVFTEAELGNVCEFDGLGRFQEFLTRSGTDPAHLSGPDTGLVTPEPPPPPPPRPTLVTPGPTRISGYVGKPVVHQLRLAKPTPADGVPEGTVEVRKVRVAPFEPQFDKTSGHYCDIGVDPAATYYPFIQLGLTRYQPHAAPGLELSHPIARVVQAPPKRRGSVALSYYRKLTITLEGEGFHASRLAQNTDIDKFADHPLLNVFLVEAADAEDVPTEAIGKIKWRPVLENNQPVQAVRQKPATGTADYVKWSIPITMPPAKDGQIFGLLIEEVELVDGDVPDDKDPTKYTVETLERSPLFSKYINLADWTGRGG